MFFSSIFYFWQKIFKSFCKWKGDSYERGFKEGPWPTETNMKINLVSAMARLLRQQNTFLICSSRDKASNNLMQNMFLRCIRNDFMIDAMLTNSYKVANIHVSFEIHSLKIRATHLLNWIVSISFTLYIMNTSYVTIRTRKIDNLNH